MEQNLTRYLMIHPPSKVVNRGPNLARITPANGISNACPETIHAKMIAQSCGNRNENIMLR